MFNIQSIATLLSRCGFEILSIETPGPLDVELVRRAVLAGEFDITDQPFLQELLFNRFDELGMLFQQFVAQHGLSGNMRVFARKSA